VVIWASLPEKEEGEVPQNKAAIGPRTKRFRSDSNRTEMISEYLTETILSMLECDVDETVPNKLKRFSREVVEVLQS
jgi:hypothetical protein